MSAPAVFVEAEAGTIPATSPWYRYLTRVVRVRPGDPLRLLDGQGRERPARVEAVDRAGLTLAPTGPWTLPARPAPVLVLGVAQLPAQRFDWVVEKATELGADVIQPVTTAFSQVALEPADLPDRLARWGRKAREAVRQCGRADEPEIRPPRALAEWLAAPAPTATWLLLDREGDTSLPPLPRAGELRLLIGPEGGWRVDELEAARAAGAHALRLGPTILRAETAALAGLAVLTHALGR